jgi:hypothetical protein
LKLGKDLIQIHVRKPPLLPTWYFMILSINRQVNVRPIVHFHGQLRDISSCGSVQTEVRCSERQTWPINCYAYCKNSASFTQTGGTLNDEGQ